LLRTYPSTHLCSYRIILHSIHTHSYSTSPYRKRIKVIKRPVRKRIAAYVVELLQ